MSKNRKHKAKLYGNNDIMPCLYCGVELDFENGTVEHLIPRHLLGGNNLENLTIACAACNNTHRNPND